MRRKTNKSVKGLKTKQSIAFSLVLGSTFLAINSNDTSAGFTSSASATVLASSTKWVVDAPSFNQDEYSTVFLTWELLPFYSDYIVQWSKYTDFSRVQVAEVSGNSYTVQSLEGSTSYYFRVKPVDAPENSWSEPVVSRTMHPILSVNSEADVIAMDSAGQLWNYGLAGTNTASERSISSSANVIPETMHIVDWNNDGISDVMMKTTTGRGNLDLWKGRSGGGFDLVEVGHGGWNGYWVSFGRWSNADKYPTFLALDKVTGDLFWYGNITGERHEGRVQIDSGWLDASIVLVDYDRDGNMDILGTFPDGQMKLARSNGAGEIIQGSKQVVSTGWNNMDSISVVYGAEGTDSRGIVARETSTGDLYYYAIGKSSIGEKQKFRSGFSTFKLPGK